MNDEQRKAQSEQMNNRLRAARPTQREYHERLFPKPQPADDKGSERTEEQESRQQ